MFMVVHEEDSIFTITTSDDTSRITMSSVTEKFRLSYVFASSGSIADS
jgi:hypothetical protein